MIDLQTSGHLIQLSFSGYTGVVIFLYLLVSLILLWKTKVFPFHRTFLFLMAIKELKKSKPSHWKFTPINLISPITISKESKGLYKVFIKVSSEIYDEWTCDWIIIDSRGKILEESILRAINNYDSNYQSEIIQYNRNKNLKNLGL